MPDATRMRTLGNLFMLRQSITAPTALLPVLRITQRQYTRGLWSLSAKTACLGFAAVRHRLLSAIKSSRSAF